MKQHSDDLQSLIELRLHYTTQLARVESAIDVIREAQRLKGKFAKQVDAVRREMREAPKQRRAQSPTERRHARKDGTSPAARIRRVFHDIGDTPITREAIIERTDLVKAVSHMGGRGNDVGKANRMVGWVLSDMKRKHEIKQTRDGAFIAHRLQPLASVNGTEVHAG